MVRDGKNNDAVRVRAVNEPKRKTSYQQASGFYRA
jgi:hypothetical protein